MKNIILTSALIASALISAPTFAAPAKLAVCAACHGQDGNSPIPGYPTLAGKDKAYLVEQLNAFKNDTRADAVIPNNMNNQAKGLSDAEIDELSAHFSTQAPK
ncbi:c-type cytochrome [Solemya elarraichensis gill symbiont]|uniref:Cytochrome c domain-containing protein n=1 Tax=Solemya elarraichensis gill symbiont TaxID=1918949 RepID=A0A1T2LBQ4_9GAMM|nr:cytochrome c [Solemya elarraichensis gill symbiont]OOZ42537.1 hypothetical protein BOW52_02665 [Solemya elarraichensis gill symbiont]